MICQHCGHTVRDGALTCESCGSFLGGYGTSAPVETGVRSMRQGRRSAQTGSVPGGGASHEIKEYGDYDLSDIPVRVEGSLHRPRTAPVMDTGKQPRRSSSRPDTHRGVPVNARGHAPVVPRKHGKLGSPTKRGPNWARILIALTCVAIVCVVGYFIYMSRSDTGQRITARRNVLASTEGLLALAQNTDDPEVQTEREELLKQWNESPAQSYWLVGQDYMDVGDVTTAIQAFKLANVIDPDNYDGLLQLANAYELDNNDPLAEEVYLDLATKVSPFRSEAYTALIRMYQDQERRPEAADMMKLAYEQTDKENFRLQRKDYIPLTPQVDLPAGRYEMEQVINLISPQGYDIYYTTDNEAVLPKDGKLATDGGLTLHEGSITLRAVCVSGDLTSDPMAVTYTIYYPTPPAPKCNLAPNTYKSKRDVSLRAGEGAEEQELVFHYTIDGSMPTEDSPVYDGTPIPLPSGRVTLRAICINQYGKMSSTLEVTYKFLTKPDPLKIYSEEDAFLGFKLGKSTIDDFKEQFGNPQEEIETTYLTLTGEARHLTYPWGYAVFRLNGNTWQMVRVEMNQHFTTEPRGVGLGSTEAEICGVYKDFGQPQSASGARGLYYAYPDVGQVLVNDDGTRTISYSCLNIESDMWLLEYHIASNGRCDRIAHYYQP